MQTQALSVSRTSPPAAGRLSLQRVRDAVAALGCPHVWARASGPHVLVGLPNDDAFARLTPLGGAAYGLAFRSSGEEGGGSRWEAMLLIDELRELVEHALVAVDALRI
jgi:hypothetical protein